MGKNPLQVLKGGLSKLKETVKKWKESLLLQLQKQQKISEDEDWLEEANSSTPAGIARHETNFNNILFHLKLFVIIVFTQYIVI
jgi:hypothetical protein